MSTHWDIVCVDCPDGGARAGFHLNHGEHTLTAIIKILPTLATTVDAMRLIDESGCHSMGWYGGNGPTMVKLARFARDHSGHKLKLLNEYGRFSDQCHDYYKCKCCDAQLNCKRPLDHEGLCGGIKNE